MCYVLFTTIFSFGCYYQLGKTASEHKDNMYTQNHWDVNKPYLTSGMIGSVTMWVTIFLPKGNCCCRSIWNPFFRAIRITIMVVSYCASIYFQLLTAYKCYFINELNWWQKPDEPFWTNASWGNATLCWSIWLVFYPYTCILLYCYLPLIIFMLCILSVTGQMNMVCE